MEISVRQTNLRPNLIKTLISKGIVLITHLRAFDVNRLAAKTRLSIDDCETILAAFRPKKPYVFLKASELVYRPFGTISTLTPELDTILNGGIRCGQVTEISGEAGAGKSNLCLMISANVIKESEVLYIHTEGEGKLVLSIKRLKSLVEDESLIRDNLRVINCENEYELSEIINRLPDTIEGHKNAKLVVIDSITSAFISVDSIDYLKRSLRLTNIMKMLAPLAWDKRLAIILTNHVSYNMKERQNRPAMGKLWSHMCQTKIFLERRDNGFHRELSRYAYVTKGASNSPSRVKFNIS